MPDNNSNFWTSVTDFIKRNPYALTVPIGAAAGWYLARRQSRTKRLLSALSGGLLGGAAGLAYKNYRANNAPIAEERSTIAPVKSVSTAVSSPADSSATIEQTDGNNTPERITTSDIQRAYVAGTPEYKKDQDALKAALVYSLGSNELSRAEKARLFNPDTRAFLSDAWKNGYIDQGTGRKIAPDTIREYIANGPKGAADTGYMAALGSEEASAVLDPIGYTLPFVPVASDTAAVAAATNGSNAAKLLAAGRALPSLVGKSAVTWADDLARILTAGRYSAQTPWITPALMAVGAGNGALLNNADMNEYANSKIQESIPSQVFNLNPYTWGKNIGAASRLGADIIKENVSGNGSLLTDAERASIDKANRQSGLFDWF